MQRLLGLLIHNSSHALQSGIDLFRANDTVQHPVGNMLAGNTQRSAVFHQAHIVNIRNLRATYALINPTYYVSQNTLRVVIEFLLNVFRAPAWRFYDGNG